MELLVAGYEIIEQQPGIDGIFKAIELPGRVCYHSQDKITPESAKPFVEGLMQRDHGAPLEHGAVYLMTKDDIVYRRYLNNQYSKVKTVFVDNDNNTLDTPEYYISTNLRVLYENKWLDDLYYFCEPTEYHERRIIVRFTIDRFTGEEFLRHRKGSFNRESTRYINFVKEKFGNGSIKFIMPCWLYDRKEDVVTNNENNLEYYCNLINKNQTDTFSDIDYWIFSLKAAEWSYNNLIKCGWQAQQARTVLPCAINSPLIMTAFISDWKHFFNLRALGTTGAPHPQAKELAEPLMYDFIERGYIEKEFIKNEKC